MDNTLDHVIYRQKTMNIYKQLVISALEKNLSGVFIISYCWIITRVASHVVFFSGRHNSTRNEPELY